MLELLLMPITKSAKKKLRKDRVRTRLNRAKKVYLKEAIKKARARRTKQYERDAISLIDKAAKTELIHKNKASRLKSKLSKLASKPSNTSESKSVSLHSNVVPLLGSKPRTRVVVQGKKQSAKKARNTIKAS